MRLGIGLPTWLGNVIEPAAVLDFARRAEGLGFDAVAVHDRPNHDTWDPVATLAAVAAVTERVRLATTAVLLPTRNETLLAKQAAVVDRVSGGRLDLGVAVGAREGDFDALGRPFAGRGREFERQLGRLNELFVAAQASREDGGAPGPASIQEPRPRLWVGGYADPAYARALAHGDGYIFGAAGVEAMARRTPQIRQLAEAAGRPGFPVAGLAYVLPATDQDEIREAERLLVRYYGSLHKPFTELVHIGDEEVLERTIGAYRETGLEVLYLIPVGRSIELVDRLASIREAALA